jgi:hypothetical protein
MKTSSTQKALKLFVHLVDAQAYAVAAAAHQFYRNSLARLCVVGGALLVMFLAWSYWPTAPSRVAKTQ